MDSKPTKAHGAKAKMVNIPDAALLSVEKAGVYPPVPNFPATTAKQMTTPINKRTAIIIWVTAAGFRNKQIKAASTSAPSAKRISPT